MDSVIFITTLLALATKTATSNEIVCPDNIEDVTSQCLGNYVTKVQHLHSYGHDFYTGVDVEDMRSLCAAMTHALNCAGGWKRHCPNLEHQDPKYPNEFIAVYNLCHAANLYEIYAMNQFCYSNIRASTRRCEQRFSGRVAEIMPAVYAGESETIAEYCREFSEFVNCVWALVFGNCGSQAATLAEALVRPAVAESGLCVSAPITVQPRSSASTTTEADIHKYHPQHEESGSKNNRDQGNNVEYNKNNVYRSQQGDTDNSYGSGADTVKSMAFKCLLFIFFAHQVCVLLL